MNYIINYITDVLIHFTKPGITVKECLRNYLDNVFIKIVDIWGFISVYFVFIQILSHNYSKLTKQEMDVFNKIKYLFVEYFYNPRHEPIPVNKLYLDLEDLSKLFEKRLNIKTEVARGVNKTRKNGFARVNISFKRRPAQKRFKKPFLLSFKIKKNI
jgi:hypothetical protein